MPKIKSGSVKKRELSSSEITIVIMGVASFLSPPYVLKFALLNKDFFKRIMEFSVYWENLMKIHFPEDCIGPAEFDPEYWATRFKKIYEKKYYKLNKDEKEFLGFIKSSSLHLISKKDIPYSTLTSLVDINMRSLLFFIVHYRADLSLYFYQKFMFCRKYMQGMGAESRVHSEDWVYKNLHWAAIFNQLDVFILEHINNPGIDFNVMTFFGKTPLYLAACMGNLDIVKYLIKNGADFNWHYPICIAAEEGHLEIVALLIENGVDVNASLAIYCAVVNGHVDIVALLLNHNANPNIHVYEQQYSLIHVVCSRIDVICENVDLQRNYLAIIDLLIDAGVDINSVTVNGDTPLHSALRHAAYFGTQNIEYFCNELIEREADIHYVNDEGYTPMDCMELLTNQFSNNAYNNT